MANPNLATSYGFDQGDSFDEQFSMASFENFLFEVLAFALFVHEQLFKKHRNDIDEQLYNQKSGRLPWYRFMALQFQSGFSLLPDSDKFDNTNATPEEIENSKIVQYAAVNETDDESRVIIKIAAEDSGELMPINETELEAFEFYVSEFKWAGVPTTVVNLPPDKLFLQIEVYRDPLVLDTNGVSISNGNIPVEDAIEEYMKELPFNGQFVIADFVDKLQEVEGVEIPHIVGISSSYIEAESEGYGEPVFFDVRRIPQSGYFKVSSFENINYVV